MIRFEALLRQSAARDPERTALVCRHARTSYAQLDAAADQFAIALGQRAEFRNGDRCVLFAENRLETAVGIFGTLRAGGVFSVINPTTKADKLAFVLNNCEASVLVTQASWLPRPACRACVAWSSWMAPKTMTWVGIASWAWTVGAVRLIQQASTSISPCWSTRRAPPASPRA